MLNILSITELIKHTNVRILCERHYLTGNTLLSIDFETQPLTSYFSCQAHNLFNILLFTHPSYFANLQIPLEDQHKRGLLSGIINVYYIKSHFNE